MESSALQRFRDSAILISIGLYLITIIITRKSTKKVQTSPPPGRHFEFCRQAEAYFHPKSLLSDCQNGEDILNHAQPINCKWKIFSTDGDFELNSRSKLTYQKLIATFDADAEHSCRISLVFVKSLPRPCLTEGSQFHMGLCLLTGTYISLSTIVCNFILQ